MRAGLDNNILVWAIRKDLPPIDDSGRDVADLQRRARILVEDLDRKDFTIVIPAVVVSEFLCGIHEQSHGNVLAAIKARFFTQPFDDRAAAIAAGLYRFGRTLDADLGRGKRVLKLDTMIVASARVAGCSIFYSNDERCRKLAEKSGMIARDLPTHSEDLIVTAEASQAPEEGGLPPLMPDDLPPFSLEGD